MTDPYILFNAQASNATSEDRRVTQYNRFTFYIDKAAAGAATVAIESISPLGTWQQIHSKAFTAAGSEVVAFEGPFKQLRAVVSGWVGGTVSVSFDAQGS